MKNRFVQHVDSAQGMGKKQTFDSMENLPEYTLPHCRICLEETGQLTQLPCACIGDVGLVHEKCFTQWIETLRNDRFIFSNRARSIANVSQNYYEIPCEICKSNIRIEMQEKRGCIKCKDSAKPEIFFALFCIIFNLAVLGVVTYFCINGIIKSADNGLRIFINVFIMAIMYLILGWIIKKEVQRLFVKSITNLKIVPRDQQANDNNQIVNFVVEEEHNEPQPKPNENRNINSNTDVEERSQSSTERRRRRRSKRQNRL